MFASFRVIKLVGIVGVVGMFGLTGSAFGQVVGSAHDLQTELSADGVCVVCHTPHGGDNLLAPLWNHETNVATAYTEYASTTLDETFTAVGGVSLACLGCHDGTIGLDAFAGTGGVVGGTGTKKMIDLYASTTAVIGTSLLNQHPISITYKTVDLDFKDATAVTANDAAGGLVLYGNKVECGSCHDPHDTTNSPFLRKSNDNSGLCVTCHSK